MIQVPNITLVHNGTIMIEGNERPVVDVRVIPGVSSDPAKLHFWWNCTGQDDYTLTF